MSIGAKVSIIIRTGVIAVWIWGIFRYMYPDNVPFAGTLIVWLLVVGLFDFIYSVRSN